MVVDTVAIAISPLKGALKHPGLGNCRGVLDPVAPFQALPLRKVDLVSGAAAWAFVTSEVLLLMIEVLHHLLYTYICIHTYCVRCI